MKKRYFTLIEIVVALGILALSLGGLLQLLVNSQLRIARSLEKWQELHIITQAAEYLMLHDEETTAVPPDYFPYPDYEIVCEYEDAENLPEDYSNLTGQIPLKKCKIELVRLRDQKKVETLVIDRFGYGEGALESE